MAKLTSPCIANSCKSCCDVFADIILNKPTDHINVAFSKHNKHNWPDDPLSCTSYHKFYYKSELFHSAFK